MAKIEAVCKAHKVKLPEAALRFPLNHPAVVSVIPGAMSPREVALNVEDTCRQGAEGVVEGFESGRADAQGCAGGEVNGAEYC